LKKQRATDSVLIVHFVQILTPLYRVKWNTLCILTLLHTKINRNAEK